MGHTWTLLIRKISSIQINCIFLKYHNFIEYSQRQIDVPLKSVENVGKIFAWRNETTGEQQYVTFFFFVGIVLF